MIKVNEQIYEVLANVYLRPNKEKKKMITVAVFINGAPLVSRSAVNQGITREDGMHEYLTDAGVLILHDRNKEGGSIELAKALLDTIDKRIC